MTTTSGRPGFCRVCDSLRIRQLAAERLDYDGEVMVGIVECDDCHARFIYTVKAPRTRPTREREQQLDLFDSNDGRDVLQRTRSVRRRLVATTDEGKADS